MQKGEGGPRCKKHKWTTMITMHRNVPKKAYLESSSTYHIHYSNISVVCEAALSAPFSTWPSSLRPGFLQNPRPKTFRILLISAHHFSTDLFAGLPPSISCSHQRVYSIRKAMAHSSCWHSVWKWFSGQAWLQLKPGDTSIALQHC